MTCAVVGVITASGIGVEEGGGVFDGMGVGFEEEGRGGSEGVAEGRGREAAAGEAVGGVGEVDAECASAGIGAGISSCGGWVLETFFGGGFDGEWLAFDRAAVGTAGMGRGSERGEVTTGDWVDEGIGFGEKEAGETGRGRIFGGGWAVAEGVGGFGSTAADGEDFAPGGDVRGTIGNADSEMTGVATAVETGITFGGFDLVGGETDRVEGVAVVIGDVAGGGEGESGREEGEGFAETVG